MKDLTAMAILTVIIIAASTAGFFAGKNTHIDDRFYKMELKLEASEEFMDQQREFNTQVVGAINQLAGANNVYSN